MPSPRRSLAVQAGPSRVLVASPFPLPDRRHRSSPRIRRDWMRNLIRRAGLTFAADHSGALGRTPSNGEDQTAGSAMVNSQPLTATGTMRIKVGLGAAFHGPLARSPSSELPPNPTRLDEEPNPIASD